MSARSEVDAVVVGAGFGGLYALHRLRGLGLAARAFEAGDGVGGTWYWNRYPGARCDIESLDYQFTFDPDLVRDWRWSERYPSQPEILRYLEHVADRYGLRDDIQLSTRVTEAAFDEATGRWTVRTDRGDEVSARFCIMATGCLSSRNEPDFPGLADFGGDWYHTGAWPHEGVDLTGKRVAVVGTGSSGIQSIPVIAEQAAELIVFQRTANYSIPSNNGPLGSEEETAVLASFEARRRMVRESYLGMSTPGNDVGAMDVSEQEREREFQARWDAGGLVMYGAFNDLLLNPESNAAAADFLTRKIRARVRDPETAEALIPRGFPFGTKRLCVDNGYFETFDRDDVSIVDVRDTPIEAITERGIRTTDREHEVDVIVFAIGFDAMTGALSAIDIRGRDGRALRDAWSAGPRTYLGIASAGFPNLLLITGPGSPSVLSNMVASIEQHVDWIADLMEFMGDQGADLFEATTEAQDAWVDHVNELASATLVGQADSWYMGANVPGKPRVFMPYLGGVGPYRALCDEVAADGYRGFAVGERADGARTP
jgi:cyclohexanone monooxygenase